MPLKYCTPSAFSMAALAEGTDLQKEKSREGRNVALVMTATGCLEL